MNINTILLHFLLLWAVVSAAGHYRDPPSPPTCGPDHPLLASADDVFVPLGSLMEYSDYQPFIPACPGYSYAMQHWSCCPPAAALFLVDVVHPITSPFGLTGGFPDPATAHAAWQASPLPARCEAPSSADATLCKVAEHARLTTEAVAGLSSSKIKALTKAVSACGGYLAGRLAGMACLLCDPWHQHFEGGLNIADNAGDNGACESMLTLARDLGVLNHAQLLTSEELSTAAGKAKEGKLMLEVYEYEALAWAAVPSTPEMAEKRVAARAPKAGWPVPVQVLPVQKKKIEVQSCTIAKDLTFEQPCVHVNAGSTINSTLYVAPR